MEPKTYGLDTLALIYAGRTGTTDEEAWIADIEKAMRPYYAYNDEKAEPRYEVRDGGLWRNSKCIAVAGTSTAALDVLEWQPIASSAKPALPVPFTACEFAAFTLAGMGIFAIERFEGLNDEDELAALGRNGADAKEVLREAHRLRLEATQRFGHNIAKETEPPCIVLDDAETDKAAAWLLNDAHLEMAAAAARVCQDSVARNAIELQRCVPPAELLAAYKPWLKAGWFEKLEGWLLKARRREGTPGRGGRPALFCPHAVMVGLTTKARRQRLPQARGRHILRERFPDTYAAFEAQHPQTDTAADE